MRAATTTDASADRLMNWMRRVEDLQKGPYVSAIGRFSHPPRLEDLDALSLDDADLNDLRRCRPGKCGVKLSDVEILGMRAAIDAAEAEWRAAAQRTFRAMVLARAERYVTEGHTPMRLITMRRNRYSRWRVRRSRFRGRAPPPAIIYADQLSVALSPG